MEKIEKFVNNQKKLTTVIAVINAVSEYTEKERKTGVDKLDYGLRMFHVLVKELRKHDKISQELAEQCERLTEHEVEDYINDVVSIWNRTVPILKRLKRFMRKLKCSKKEK